MSGTMQHLMHLAVSDGFLRILIEVALKICVVFCLAAVAALVLSKSSAARRYVVWVVSFLAFLFLPIVSGAVPKLHALPGWLAAGEFGSPAREPGTELTDARTSFNSSGPIFRDHPTSATERPVSDSTQSAIPFGAVSTTFRTMAGPAPALVTPSHFFFALWFIGTLLFLLRIGLGRVALYQVSRSADSIQDGPIREDVEMACRRLGIRRRVRVFLSSRRSTPMTWGIVRPQVLLPAEATRWERRRFHAVLLHELAHLKHYDTITHLLMQFVRAVYWFHPAVWLAAWRLQVERERACDDTVLQHGIRPSDYAEDLLSIVACRQIPSSALAIVGRSDLEGRLRAILNDKMDRRTVTTSVVVLTLVLGIMATTVLAALVAQDPPAGESPSLRSEKPPNGESPGPDKQSVHVFCVDASGKPVSGAEVHLFQYSGAEQASYVHFGPLVSDGQGRAVCTPAMFSSERGNFDRFIYARLPGRLVGVARSSKWTGRRVFNPDGRIVLEPSRSLDGRVSLPEKYDPTRVTVRVRVMNVATGPAEFDFESFPRQDTFRGLDTALPNLFERHPDSQGRFQLADVPVRGRLYLIADGKGLGEGQWWNQGPSQTFEHEVRITMGWEGIASGRVLAPNGKPAAGMNVVLRISAKATWETPKLGVLSEFRAVTDPAGTFTLRGLPQTRFVESVEDPKKRWAFRPVEDVYVFSGKATTVTAQMEVGSLVSGRVLDPQGNPVPAVGISAYADSQNPPRLGSDSTDAAGRYQFRLPSGGAKLAFNSLPDGFDYPHPNTLKHLEIKTGQLEIRDVDFTVQRHNPNRAQPARSSQGESQAHATKGKSRAGKASGDNSKHENVAEFLKQIRLASEPILAEMAARHGYRLEPGQSIRRVPPPYDPIRMTYYRIGNPTQAKAIPEGPSAICFHWNGEQLTQWGMTFGPGILHGYALTGLIDAIQGIKRQQIEGPADLLQAPIPGDWICRPKISDEIFAQELQKILQVDLMLPVRLTFRSQERKAYVAQGRYHFTPLPGQPGETTLHFEQRSQTMNDIQIFGKELVPNSGAGGGCGNFSEFLTWLGRWIDTPVVDEVQERPSRQLCWALHERSPMTETTTREAHDPVLVLHNVEKQTGLHFTAELRKVKTLFVERTD